MISKIKQKSKKENIKKNHSDIMDQQIIWLNEKENTKGATELAGDDIIELNVQGTLFYTTRHTLTQIPGSRLTYFFNGRYKLSRDSQNRVFLDILPSQFRKLLDYLTIKRFLKKNQNTPLPQLDAKYERYFKNMVKYFGLEYEIYGMALNFSRELKSASIILDDKATNAKLNEDGYAFILSERVYENEFVEFTLIVNYININFPKMFIGVMANTSDPIEDNSFDGNTLSYGFSELGQIWYAGNIIENEEGDLNKLFYSGVEIKLVLCCKNNENYLSLTINDTEDSLLCVKGLPNGQKWRLHVNMARKDNEITLLNVQDAGEFSI